jgi:transmembrane sensor
VERLNTPETERDAIDREAADWVVRWDEAERSPGRREQARWFSWLQRSPAHVQAFFDTADLHERLGRMDPKGRIDVDAWLSERRAPVVSLATTGANRNREAILAEASRRPKRWIPFAAAAALASVALGSLLWSRISPVYRTQVGQQSIYKLADGSVMSLNTSSRVRARFSGEQRLIELTGEAVFTVAPDPARPFIVRTRGATIRALGTKFNVYELMGETRVAVIEGKVQVTAGAESALLQVPGHERMALAAGEAASVTRGQVARQELPDVVAAVAWQRQQIVFEDATLAEVATEFNRYNERQIRIEGPLARGTRLSGTFDALHPQSLLLYLRKDAGLEVRESDEGVTVLEREPASAE